jgi:hypothetical protein
VLLAMVVGLTLCAGALASSVRAAETCANAVQRAESGSGELPDCRAYEMVSSPYKEGFDIDPTRFTDDGIVSYFSLGSFAGNAGSSLRSLYHAERSAAGWATTALTPSGVTYETTGAATSGESADLRSSLWVMRRRDPAEVTNDIYRRNAGGDFVYVGEGATTNPAGLIYQTPTVRGASGDLSHVVFNYSANGTFDTALWEYVGTGNGGLPRAVSVDNLGSPTPGQTCHSKTSDDGRVVVFRSGCNGGLLQLWARVAGSATVAVSGSECSRGPGDVGGVCNGLSAAAYEDSSDDGSRVFFSTSQQLVNGDIDQGDDLYACDMPSGVPVPAGPANRCATLTQVSALAGGGAQVESVAAVSSDGSRVYFVAQGVVAENPGVGHGDSSGPVPGAHNLYLWVRDAAHPGGQTKFIAGLDGDDVAKAQMTPDGRYLVFLTSSTLAASDIDGGRDVYRYDSVTGSLVRVSTSVSGAGGNAAGLDADLGRASSGLLASVTANGGSIVFDTAEALSPADTDGVSDVYGWRDGQVSLISKDGGNVLWISPSGRDIFFLTDVGLLPGDRDVSQDIYDARLGGGFDAPTVRSCSGDECQGRVSDAPGPAPPPAPPVVGGPPKAASTLSLGRVSTAQRRRFAATGKLVLLVTTNAAGTISVQASTSVGGRSVTVGSARRTVAGPGRVSVSLVLSKKAREQLAARGKLSVRVSASHSKVALDRSVTLRLVHAKTNTTAKRRAGGSRASRSVGRGDEGRS